MNTFIWVILTGVLLSCNSYRLGPSPIINWFDANDYCANTFNSTLATIYTPEQNEEAIKLCLNYRNKTNLTVGCWIGLEYDDYNGNWLWTENDIESSFYYWAHNQPSDPSVEPHAEIRITSWEDQGLQVFLGEWNDASSTSEERIPLCNDPPQGMYYIQYTFVYMKTFHYLYLTLQNIYRQKRKELKQSMFILCK